MSGRIRRNTQSGPKLVFFNTIGGFQTFAAIAKARQANQLADIEIFGAGI